jgi:hypothetical protein
MCFRLISDIEVAESELIEPPCFAVVKGNMVEYLYYEQGWVHCAVVGLRL